MSLLRFHLSPVVIVWQGPPTGIRLHQSPSRPVFTPSLWLPCWHIKQVKNESVFIRIGPVKNISKLVWYRATEHTSLVFHLLLLLLTGGIYGISCSVTTWKTLKNKLNNNDHFVIILRSAGNFGSRHSCRCYFNTYGRHTLTIKDLVHPLIAKLLPKVGLSLPAGLHTQRLQIMFRNGWKKQQIALSSKLPRFQSSWAITELGCRGTKEPNRPLSMSWFKVPQESEFRVPLSTSDSSELFWWLRRTLKILVLMLWFTSSTTHQNNFDKWYLFLTQTIQHNL